MIRHDMPFLRENGDVEGQVQGLRDHDAQPLRACRRIEPHRTRAHSPQAAKERDASSQASPPSQRSLSALQQADDAKPLALLM